VQPPWKTKWKFPKNLKKDLPYDPGIPILDIYLRKTKTLNSKRYMHPCFIAALFA